MIDHFAREYAEGFAPEDVQGVLCGLLCSHHRQVHERWLAYLEVEATDDIADQAEQIVNDTRQALLGQNAQLDLLMPEDNQPIDRRIEAIANWCQSFLAGWSLGGLQDPDELNASAREVYDDFMQLTHAAVDEEAQPEEAEEAYTELSEYIRAAAQLVYLECDPAASAAEEDTPFLDDMH